MPSSSPSVASYDAVWQKMKTYIDKENKKNKGQIKPQAAEKALDTRWRKETQMYLGRLNHMAAPAILKSLQDKRSIRTFDNQVA